MGKPTGFLEFTRELPSKRPVNERKLDYKEIDIDLSFDQVQSHNAARCMDCGIPFCHNGCPLGNIIPEFNDAVYEGNWEMAYEILSSTNNFPEFTGRICPAPCEASCVLGINKPPVTIEYIEKSIIEYAFLNGYVRPNIMDEKDRTGKKVAIVGAGPAGLAAAAQLNKAGHWVTVYERADQVGGLLRYGIPDFKLEKWTIDRRVKVMEEEGIVFKTGVNIGVDISGEELLDIYDLVLLSGGSTVARGINRTWDGKDVAGWDTYFGKGVHAAMEFLSQQNKRVAGIDRVVDHRGMPYENGELLATGKNVLVIGGGDTGSDCIGTSNRHQAAKITQVEVMPEPPKDRHPNTPWPLWPNMKRTSTSHDEGCERHWSISVKEFIGDGEKLTHVRIADLVMDVVNGKAQQVEKNERVIDCDLALIAAGFLHPQREGLLAQLAEKGMTFDTRGNVQAENYQTEIDKVFVAGDMRRGQSLVVWAISEGREAARAADLYLNGGTSKLEAKAKSMFAVV
ncbi:MAG: glutamate synthase subunit beta [Siphonobacter sp.]